jgi:hypothetical protein
MRAKILRIGVCLVSFVSGIFGEEIGNEDWEGVVIEDDPFSDSSDQWPWRKIPKVEEGFARETNIDLVYEVFSLSLVEGARLLRAHPGEEALYESLVSGVKDGAVKQEEFQSVMARPGEEVALTDEVELLYPTDYEPPEGVLRPPDIRAYNEAFVPLMPSVFECGVLGSGLSAIPLMWRERDLIEVELLSRMSAHTGMVEWGQSPSVLRIPQIGVSSIETRILVRSGKAAFLGTLSEHGKGNEDVRFAFLTATSDTEMVSRAVLSKWLLRYEVFSLPLKEAAGIRRRGAGERSLYQKVLEVEEERGGRQERLLWWQGKPGEICRVQQVTEYIYPSDYEPPGSGVVARQSWDASDVPRSFPFVPWLYDTKNLGESLKADVCWGEDGEAKVRLSAKHCEIWKMHSFGKGMARSKRPEFSEQNLDSGMTMPIGVPTLAGTVTPANEVGRGWWAFVTVSRGE